MYVMIKGGNQYGFIHVIFRQVSLNPTSQRMRRKINSAGSTISYIYSTKKLRAEQNRTVSLLISGHIHDIEIQCEQQNVIYKGLGIFFSLLNTELLYR